MAIKQPKHFKNTPIYFPQIAGTAMTTIVSYTLSGAHTAASDFFELAVLPHFCKLTDVTIETEGVAEAVTLDVGFVTGEARSTVEADRTLGTELVAAGAKAGQSLSIADLNAIAPTDKDRGIGVNFSGNVAGGTIHLRISYIA